VPPTCPPTPETLCAAVLDMEAAYTDASTRPDPVVLHDNGDAHTIADGTVLKRSIYKWMGVVTTQAGAGVASNPNHSGPGVRPARAFLRAKAKHQENPNYQKVGIRISVGQNEISVEQNKIRVGQNESATSSFPNPNLVGRRARIDRKTAYRDASMTEDRRLVL